MPKKIPSKLSIEQLTVAKNGYIESLEVKEDFTPQVDDHVDLGSSSKQFKDAYIDGKAYIDQLGENLDANSKEIKKIKHILRKATASPTPGVSGSYGTGVDITPTSGYYGIIPLAGTITWGGTFAAGETVTVKVTATYSDGTTASITRDRTDTEGTGTEEISITNLLDLLKDGVAITKLTVASTSSAASTSVTTSATIGGRNT